MVAGVALGGTARGGSGAAGGERPAAPGAGVDLGVAALVRSATTAPPTAPPAMLGPRRLPARPRRIVTTAPSATELVFALGAGDRVVGVSRYDDYPPAVEALPKVGGIADPSVEAIVALRPDLVIGVASAGSRGGLERLAGLGVPVLAVPASSLSDVFVSARAVGAALGDGAPDRALALERDITRDLARLAVAARRGPAAARVAIVYGWKPLVLAGSTSFAGAIAALLGATNIAPPGGTAYPQVSMEQLVAARPDIIVDLSGASDERYAPWAGFRTIPAVRDGRVHALRTSALMRPGPRLVEGAKALAAVLGPGSE